ncbi:MAG: hypothetical protein HZA50_14850 [Planctomycetes bacterium]|nr:hypothetical protein [Planctomycetota bacterium]
MWFFEKEITVGFILIIWPAVPVLTCLLCPWFLGRQFRRAGKTSPGFLRRFGVCVGALLLGIASTLLTGFVVKGILEAVFQQMPLWMLWLFLAIPSATACFFIVRWIIKVGLKSFEVPPGKHIFAATILLFALCGMEALSFVVFYKQVWYADRYSVVKIDLFAIAKGLELYTKENSGRRPYDLGKLVEGNFISNKCIWDYNKGQLPFPTSKPYIWPCSLEYLELPVNAPANLVITWKRPIDSDPKGYAVLYNNYEVKWVKPDELNEELQRTRLWLEEHGNRPVTIPASVPATAP